MGPRDPAILDLARRARTRFEAGANVTDVVRYLRSVEELDAVWSIAVLRAIEPVSLSLAMTFVDGTETFAHIGLKELQWLANLPSSTTLESWLTSDLQAAILKRLPWWTFTSASPDSVTVDSASTPSGQPKRSIVRPVSIDWIRDDVQTALQDMQWREELRIVRDDDSVLVIEFPRVAAMADGTAR